MRRLLRYDLLHFMLLFFVAVALIQGCARPELHTYPALEHEIESVASAFLFFQKISEEVCNCCLDAEADAAISVSGWFSDHTGNLTGYLQAMEPSYIKYIATNPLGQPLFIFMTNGKMFKGLNVFEEKAYLGSVSSEAYKKFVPPGYDPEFSYYWLTGRLPPGNGMIKKVMRDKEHDAFWLQIINGDPGTDSMVLFDPENMVILRHVLRNERGEHLVDVEYAGHQPLSVMKSNNTGSGSATTRASEAEKELCRIPAKIIVSSGSKAEKIEVEFHSIIDDAHFSEANFFIKIPDNFERLFVK